jgi:hypothetical protein
MRYMIKDDELTDELSEIFQAPPESILPKKELPVVQVESQVVETTEIVPIIVQAKTKEQIAKEDFDYSRKTLKEVIDTGKDALNSLADMAECAGNARVHEILGELMRSIADSTMQLFELHQRMKDFDKSDEKKGDVINNNLFVTTNELIDFMKKHGKTEK